MRSGLITHPDKVLFPERGETKADLAEHYLRVAGPLMRTMGGRPVLLQRFPEGAGGPSFFQKQVPKNAGLAADHHGGHANGTASQALVAADTDHVLWAVNLGCLGFHVWPYLARRPRATPTSCGSTSTRPPGGVPRRSARPPASYDGSSPRLVSPVISRRPGTVACTCTSGSSHAGIPIRSARPPWPWPGNSNGGGPTSSRPRGGKRNGASRVFVDYNQNAPHKTVFGAS